MWYDDNGDPVIWEKWRKMVEKEIYRRCGINSEFLPDVDFYGLWMTGNSPTEAADFVLENARNT